MKWKHQGEQYYKHHKVLYENFILYETERIKYKCREILRGMSKSAEFPWTLGSLADDKARFHPHTFFNKTVYVYECLVFVGRILYCSRYLGGKVL